MDCAELLDRVRRTSETSAKLVLPNREDLTFEHMKFLAESFGTTHINVKSDQYEGTWGAVHPMTTIVIEQIQKWPEVRSAR